MITCEECGKVNGQGQTGTSWICEDCCVEPEHEKEESQDRKVQKDMKRN